MSAPEVAPTTPSPMPKPITIDTSTNTDSHSDDTMSSTNDNPNRDTLHVCADGASDCTFHINLLQSNSGTHIEAAPATPQCSLSPPSSGESLILHQLSRNILMNPSLIVQSP